MAKKEIPITEEEIKDNEVATDAAENTDNPTEVEEGGGEVEEKPKTKDDQIAELELLVGESKDKYLRLYAEFDNFKKRSIKEKIDYLKSAKRETIHALLPVLDDFDRAKQSADDDDSVEQFSDGVNLVYNKLKGIMANQGLKVMESTGEVFDPELHEALTEIPAPSEDMKGKIIDTIDKGYTLNDKIIRHAKVVVGK